HALIFSRRKGRGNVLQQEVDAPPYDRQHRKHPGGVVQARPQTLPVGTLQPAEHVIHTAGDKAVVGVVVQQLGAHHWSQRQRQQTGEDDGTADGDGQLIKDDAQAALHEHHGHEHRHDDGGGGENRERYLPRAIEGRQQRCLPTLYPPLDVLQHHDGVVDDESDTQHQTQQGDQVDGHAEHRQHHEGGHQTHGNGHHRDQHDAERAHEHVDHEAHQRHGDKDGLVYGRNGALDEGAVTGG